MSEKFSSSIDITKSSISPSVPSLSINADKIKSFRLTPESTSFIGNPNMTSNNESNPVKNASSCIEESVHVTKQLIIFARNNADKSMGSENIDPVASA